MKNMFFSIDNPNERIKEKEKKIFNFLNLHSLYLFHNNSLFRDAVSFDNSINFPDGMMIAKKLGVSKKRGADFTRKLLSDSFVKNKKHFFIGLEEREISKLSKVIGINEKNIGAYNPPFISGIEFSKEEKEKIVKIVNDFETDFLWICVGNPKQEILAYQLFENVSCKKILNIGAALDFLLGRKKEAPRFWIELGLEWFYLGITNPKRTLKKIWLSLIALKYLGKVKGR